MGWDPLQREVLEALGHVVYAPAPPQVAPIAADALFDALLRAAGRDRTSADTPLLSREWMPTARLRGAAAKRALWPRVRALRGGSR